MSEIKYSKDHEWISVDGDVGTIGITEYAQEQLGDVVYVDLPDVGQAVEQNGECAVVESVKAASEIYAPVTGEIVDINQALNDNPGLVNQDATGEGWFFKIKLSDLSELDSLMDESGYKELIAELG